MVLGSLARQVDRIEPRFLDISCSLAQSRRLPVFVLAMLFGLGCSAKKTNMEMGSGTEVAACPEGS